jgi:hypothetical protein
MALGIEGGFVKSVVVVEVTETALMEQQAMVAMAVVPAVVPAVGAEAAAVIARACTTG